MKFYKSISKYYNFIFPLNMQQVEYTLALTENGAKKKLLDIGCGTGNLSIELAKHFYFVTAIDPDIEMLSIAQKRAKELNFRNIEFYPKGMLDIDTLFSKNSFDALISYGNTLVHLSSLEDIEEYLSKITRILKPSGKLLLQIINYERIIAQNIDGLPTIENEHIKFTRKYNYLPKVNKIEFITELEIKSTKKTVVNRINLHPINREQLIKSLNKAGFSKIKTFGGFNQSPYSTDSTPLVITAENMYK